MDTGKQNNDSEELLEVEADEILEALYTGEFDEDVDKLALALGRDRDEVERILNEGDPIDDDLEMKIRGIAQERGVEI